MEQWGYHSMNGIIPPENWVQYYKESGGKKQSPVALDSMTTTAMIEKGIQFQGQCTSLEFSTSKKNSKQWQMATQPEFVDHLLSSQKFLHPHPMKQK